MFSFIRKHKALTVCCALVMGLGFSIVSQAGGGYEGPYGLGHPASTAEIAKINIDVMPDGRGAPPGQGSVTLGKGVYADRCAACHGVDMALPVKGTGAPALRGGRGTLASGMPQKTVESYWPYASTLFDYVKRAMPFNKPGSLANDQIYAVVAYILAEGGIIDKHAVMNASTLARVKMPNRNGFIADPRPEKFNEE